MHKQETDDLVDFSWQRLLGLGKVFLNNRNQCVVLESPGLDVSEPIGSAAGESCRRSWRTV